MSDETFTFTKSKIEKYDIRWGRGEWAIFSIDEKTGLIQCHSSFGDWSYQWPNHGRKSLKHFILELERDWQYLLGKVSDKVFDFEKSVKKWKRIILEDRRKYSIKKDEAREAYDLINDLDESQGEYCYIKMMERSAVSNLSPDAWEVFSAVSVYPSQAITFAKTIWPMLCEIIRDEIKEKEAGENHEL